MVNERTSERRQVSQAGQMRQTWRRWCIAAATAAVVGSGVLTPVAARATDPTADLSATLTHAPSAGATAEPLTFTLGAHNDGPDTAAAVIAAMSFQYPFQFVSASEGCEVTNYFQTVICDFGDLASGADATAQIVITPQQGGLFVVPAAVSSETSDPDVADRSVTDSVIVKKGPSIGQRYIDGEFPVVLDRNPDAASRAYWAARFMTVFRSNRLNLISIPQGLINSNEYRRNRVREAYTRILKRAANANDVAYWVPKLAGGLPFEAFERRLFSSAEFARVWSGGTSDHIDGVYSSILGRGATNAEVDAVQSSIDSGHRTLASLALQLQRSNEGMTRVVTAMYQKVVGHAPGALSLYGAKLDLLVNGVSPETLFARLLVSNEVMVKYPATEDDYNSGQPTFDFKGLKTLG